MFDELYKIISPSYKNEKQKHRHSFADLFYPGFMCASGYGCASGYSSASGYGYPNRNGAPTPKFIPSNKNVNGYAGTQNSWGRFTKRFIEIAFPTQDLIEQGLKTGVIRQTIDINKLTFDVHENLNKPNQLIVFGRNPKTQEIILATRVNPATGEMVWHVAGLRDLADVVGMTMGTNLYSSSWHGPGIPFHRKAP